MYTNPVCDHRPRKDDTYIIRLTIGVDSLPYRSESGSIAVTLLEEIFLSTASFQTLVPNLFTQISRTILSAHPCNTSNIQK